MRMVKSVTATRSMRSRTWRMARLDPMSGAAPSRRMRANCGGVPAHAQSPAPARRRASPFPAARTSIHRASGRDRTRVRIRAHWPHDGRNVEDHDVASRLLRRRPFTDRHRSRAHHGPEFLLEAVAHRRRTGRDRQGADDRLEERRRPSPTFRTAPVRAPRCHRDVQHIVHCVPLSSRPPCTRPAFQRNAKEEIAFRRRASDRWSGSETRHRCPVAVPTRCPDVLALPTTSSDRSGAPSAAS